MLFDNITNLKSEALLKWQFNIRGGISTAAFGVTESLRYYLPLLSGEPFLYIAKDTVSARKAAEEISYLCSKKVTYLPPKDDVLLFKKFYNKDNLYERVAALDEIKRGAEFVVTTMEALMQPFPKDIPSITFYSAREYSIDSVVGTLTKMGYKRRDFADVQGEFALRGDILEVYPVHSDNAFRCDFFGDEIEKIRVIDEDRKGAEEVRSFTCLPAVDFFIDGDLSDLSETIRASAKKFKLAGAKVKSSAIINEITKCFDSLDLTNPCLSFVYPLLSNVTNDIFSCFSGCKAIFIDEPKIVYDNANSVYKEHVSRFNGLNEAGEAFDFSLGNLAAPDQVLSTFKVPCHSMQNINSTVNIFTPLSTIRINSVAAPRYQRDGEQLPIDVRNWKKSGYKVIIACGNAQRSKNLTDLALNEKVEILNNDRATDDNKAYATTFYFSNGFILHDEKLALIGTLDTFVSGLKQKKIKKRRNDNFSAPEVGDFAVHEKYGIGLVRGTERITTTEGSKDYIALEYAGGDFMYVPTDRMEQLTKYLGGEKTPMLSKLGGGEFEKIKERVRQSISQMSVNLKKLYRERSRAKGFEFSPDNALTEEFDEAFPHQLTEDQVQSVCEIKRDMESDKIMDRLLLGDVGFGKTEVAMRAAFKAVMDGKQVALVAPTTVLTEQHYRTAVDRFKDFGVRICVLNRFKTAKKIKESLLKIAAGDVDIVIGTHRIFGKDVAFKDLGLLILDEEQRFGVEHKEKLRLLKSNVDTLTMSATPIPRTLHMSLSGIRDISLILTPPKARIAVQSYVTEESPSLIRDAVLKELSRGGQVFILYNNVESIYSFADEIKTLIPEADIVVGHGQMSKDQLENEMMGFFSGKYNVLIATTIIENGIDVPEANTLIVIDADNLGLFTLYQLKGRVGRGDKVAHAYFTYKADKVLTDSAYKRLSALMEYAELGSGYKIAMRDLEIRGAGNVLGREQHGHMDKIGYELYSKLLREQLGEVTKDYETELDVKLDAYIPDAYISSSPIRLDTYKQIAEINNRDDEQRVRASLTEIFGQIPPQVENLILIAQLKRLSRGLEIIKVAVDGKRAQLTVKDLNSFKDGRLSDALASFKDCAVLSFDVNPMITVAEGGNALSNALCCKRFLLFAASLSKQSENS